MNPTVQMWVSRWALTEGVKCYQCRISDDGKFAAPIASFVGYLKIGTEIHATEDAAIAAAEKMRQSRLSGLRKQIAALERKRFDV